jgi:PadR family transcriptional regulator, regulatory protein PadR
MARRKDCGHQRDYPCTCAMGNLYRFVEPVVLRLLKEKGRTYGYQLAGEVQRCALVDTPIDRAALYRTLRNLEANGNVVSEWQTDSGGPARRLYRLTRAGERHLGEWADVLERVSEAMRRFVGEARSNLRGSGAARAPRGKRRAPRPRPGGGRAD